MPTSSDPVEFYTQAKLADLQRDCGLTTEGWYFWDETWAYAHGPYETEELCRQSLYVYGQSLW